MVPRLLYGRYRWHDNLPGTTDSATTGKRCETHFSKGAMSPTSSIGIRCTCGPVGRVAATGASAARGSGRDRPSGPSEPRAEDPVYGAIVAKVVIALLVFPVLVHAIFTGLTMILGPMLPSLMAAAESWAE